MIYTSHELRPNPFHANYILNMYNMSYMYLNKILFKPRMGIRMRRRICKTILVSFLLRRIRIFTAMPLVWYFKWNIVSKILEKKEKKVWAKKWFDRGSGIDYLTDVSANFIKVLLKNAGHGKEMIDFGDLDSIFRITRDLWIKGW